LIRSPEGLWVKAERDPQAIRVYWQARTTIQDGQFVELDANGSVDRTIPVHRMRYGDPWRQAGEIQISRELIDLCGLQDFDWFLFGLMRHSAGLIAHGFGEDPEEVMSWFDDVAAADYIVGGVYEVVGPGREPFVGLEGVRLVVDDIWGGDAEEDEEDTGEDTGEGAGEEPGRVLSGKAVVGDGNEFSFEYPLDDHEGHILAAFTISAVPAPGL